jgi:hypothetical protein
MFRALSAATSIDRATRGNSKENRKNEKNRRRRIRIARGLYDASTTTTTTTTIARNRKAKARNDDEDDYVDVKSREYYDGFMKSPMVDDRNRDSVLPTLKFAFNASVAVGALLVLCLFSNGLLGA